jgi:hypothetical protein
LQPQFAELLLQVLHQDPALPDQSRIRALSPSEWNVFTLEAVRYRLAFQVLEYLKADPKRHTLVPAACLDRLKQSVRATLMRNLRQQAHVRKILMACQTAGIPVILVKGLWLGETVYRDLKARVTGDIDLLFRPQDMGRFTHLAKSLSFDIPANITNLLEVAEASNEFPLIHVSQKIYLDVHWSLTHPTEEAPVNEDKLWERSEACSLAGTSCRSLCLEDHLLYICFHAAGHHRFLCVGPRALLDVAMLISRPPRPIDWDDLVSRAHELGWTRSAWLMFDLVRENLGIQPPQEVFSALHPKDHEISIAAIRSAAVNVMFFEQQSEAHLARNIVRLIDEPNLKDKANLLGKRLFPPKAYIANQFRTTVDTPWFLWLYVTRWGKLFKDHLPGLTKLLLHHETSKPELDRARIIKQWLEPPPDTSRP